MTIVAPVHALPLSTLIAELQRVGVGGQGATAGSSGAGSTSTTTTTTTTGATSPGAALPPGLAGSAPPAYLRCFQQRRP